MMFFKIYIQFFLYEELWETFKVKDRQGRAYHPETRGQVERKNRTIKAAISKYKSNFLFIKNILIKVVIQIYGR